MSDPLGLELEVIVSHKLGFGGSSARAASPWFLRQSCSVAQANLQHNPPEC